MGILGKKQKWDLKNSLINKIQELARQIDSSSENIPAFENDIFMLHPYCTCGYSDCPWCAGCTCGNAENPKYYINDKEVSHEEYSEFFMNMVAELRNLTDPKDIAEWEKRFEIQKSKMEVLHVPTCNFCLGEGINTKYGTESGMNAPNFWHKPSGVKVWWYRELGNQMAGKLLPDNEKKLLKIFNSCSKSLKG